MRTGCPQDIQSVTSSASVCIPTYQELKQMEYHLYNYCCCYNRLTKIIYSKTKGTMSGADRINEIGLVNSHRGNSAANDLTVNESSATIPDPDPDPDPDPGPDPDPDPDPDHDPDPAPGATAPAPAPACSCC